jgi:hypothetical protein
MSELAIPGPHKDRGPMFADVEGSTQLVQQLGEKYAATLNEQRRLLRTLNR